MRKTRYIILLAMLWSLALHAGIPEMKFRRLDTRNGLSNSQVNCVYRDSRGFVWIGTVYGLNRYDGYRVKTFFCQHARYNNHARQLYQRDYGSLGWKAMG